MSEVANRTPAQQRIAMVRSDGTAVQLRDALPPSVSVERFTRATVTALMQNEDLGTADERTFFQSLVKCAMDGLLPDGREAALVIYKGKVQYLPMIAGTRKIAAEYGWTIHTHVIYANDRFEIDLGGGLPVHIPVLVGDRGEMVGAWARATHRDGRAPMVEVMRAEDIAKAQAVAKTDMIWKAWPAQMWEKTVGHRIAKKLPLDPTDTERLSRVIEATEVQPGESGAQLYGPQDATFSEIPSANPPEEEGDDTDSTPPAVTVEDEEPGPGTDGKGPGSFIPPTGKFAEGGDHGPKTLEEILALGDDGEKWLKWALSKITSPDEYVAALWAFSEAAAPGIYQAALAAKELRA